MCVELAIACTEMLGSSSDVCKQSNNVIVILETVTMCTPLYDRKRTIPMTKWTELFMGSITEKRNVRILCLYVRIRYFGDRNVRAP